MAEALYEVADVIVEDILPKALNQIDVWTSTLGGNFNPVQAMTGMLEHGSEAIDAAQGGNVARFLSEGSQAVRTGMAFGGVVKGAENIINDVSKTVTSLVNNNPKATSQPVNQTSNVPLQTSQPSVMSSARNDQTVQRNMAGQGIYNTVPSQNQYPSGSMSSNVQFTNPGVGQGTGQLQPTNMGNAINPYNMPPSENGSTYSAPSSDSAQQYIPPSSGTAPPQQNPISGSTVLGPITNPFVQYGWK